ncbi:hypothetical protein ACTXT7_004284 [Hymenolepis weldensis]
MENKCLNLNCGREKGPMVYLKSNDAPLSSTVHLGISISSAALRTLMNIKTIETRHYQSARTYRHEYIGPSIIIQCFFTRPVFNHLPLALDLNSRTVL